MKNFNNATTSCIAAFTTVLLWTRCIIAAPAAAVDVPEDPHHVIYHRLQRNAEELQNNHRDTYTGFINAVFPNDPDIQVVHEISVHNIPDSNGLPGLAERHEMSHPEVLLLHYPNLLAYERGLLAVKYDEESRPQISDYFENLLSAVIDLRMVRQHMELAMLKEGLFAYIDTALGKPAEFTENTNHHVRNLRNLYVLQELDKYLVYLNLDFNRIVNHYADEIYTDSSLSY